MGVERAAGEVWVGTVEKTRLAPFSQHHELGRTSLDFLGFEFRRGKDRKGGPSEAIDVTPEAASLAQATHRMVQGQVLVSLKSRRAALAA